MVFQYLKRFNWSDNVSKLIVSANSKKHLSKLLKLDILFSYFLKINIVK